MRYDASNPDGVSAPNALPRAPKPEEEKEEQEKAKRLSKVAPRKLPTGTCRATNQGLQGHEDVQKVWNNWCDENCVPELWGALGGGSCTSGTETGAVGCMCKVGVSRPQP